MIWTLPGFSAACIPVTARPIAKPVKMTLCTAPTLRFIVVVNSYFDRNKEKNGAPPWTSRHFQGYLALHEGHGQSLNSRHATSYQHTNPRIRACPKGKPAKALAKFG